MDMPKTCRRCGHDAAEFSGWQETDDGRRVMLWSCLRCGSTVAVTSLGPDAIPPVISEEVAESSYAVAAALVGAALVAVAAIVWGLMP